MQSQCFQFGQYYIGIEKAGDLALQNVEAGFEDVGQRVVIPSVMAVTR